MKEKQVEIEKIITDNVTIIIQQINLQIINLKLEKTTFFKKIILRNCLTN